VRRDDHHRLARRLPRVLVGLVPDGGGVDVHAVRAERRPDEADDPRAILVPEERHVVLELEVETPPPDLELVLQALEAARQQQVPERFTVLVKGRLRILRWADVSHLSTENRLLFVHTPEGRFVLDRSLDELEGLLAPRFARIHRSAMVALDRLKELIPDAGGTGEVRLLDETRVPVSRDRMAELRRKLG